MEEIKIYEHVLNDIDKYVDKLKRIEKKAKVDLFNEIEEIENNENSNSDISMILDRIEDVNNAMDLYIKAKKVYYFLHLKKYDFDVLKNKDAIDYIKLHTDMLFKASYVDLDLKMIKNSQYQYSKEKLNISIVENNINAIISMIEKETDLIQSNSIE